MATLVEQTALAVRIDHDLDYLTQQWLAIPEVVSTWDSWDELDRLDFVLEWPLREMRLKRLRQWRDEGRFSAEQRRRFGDVERLVQRHQAEVGVLLAE